jgi:serine/threonine-protein kinase
MWAVKILPVSTDTLQEHLNEAGILKRLNHPMLPRITDIIQSASHICIIMDYLPGANLQDRLDVRGKFPEAEVRAWMGQICDVLAYLHGQKPEPVIYRDLKPSNLISDDHGHLKLIDFGTARNYRAGRDGDTAYIGTQGYASPEQYGLNQSDGRTDIYNLGMTMFHLLTGIHPVTIAHGDIRERLHDASVSDLLTAVLIRCVQLSPAKRYPDAQTCRIALMGTESALPEAAALPETRADESIVAQKPDCKKDEHARKSSPILTGLLGKRSHPSIAERPSIPVQARIAVMGAFPGSGATFSSIALSAWFSSHGYSTACVEINPSGDMCRLQKTLELSGNIEAMAEDVDGRGSFQFRRVDYHKGCRRITDIRGQRYNVTVADMGSRNGSPALDEFLRADWQLVYCPHADWKFGRMEEFLERYDPDSDETQFHYLVPQDGDGCPASLRSLFGKRSVCAFPYIRNPFILAKAEDKLLERMFRCIGLTV